MSTVAIVVCYLVGVILSTPIVIRWKRRAGPRDTYHNMDPQADRAVAGVLLVVFWPLALPIWGLVAGSGRVVDAWERHDQRKALASEADDWKMRQGSYRGESGDD